MQFLRDNGFTDEEIDKIVNNYDEDTLNTFKANSDNLVEVIKYLKEYGILDIPKLMFERIDIFYLPVFKIKDLFSHYEKESVIKVLNYDSSMFDEME